MSLVWYQKTFLQQHEKGCAILLTKECVSRGMNESKVLPEIQCKCCCHIIITWPLIIERTYDCNTTEAPECPGYVFCFLVHTRLLEDTRYLFQRRCRNWVRCHQSCSIMWRNLSRSSFLSERQQALIMAGSGDTQEFGSWHKVAAIKSFFCVSSTVNVLKSKKELWGNIVCVVRNTDQRLIWSHEDFVRKTNIVSLSGTWGAPYNTVWKLCVFHLLLCNVILRVWWSLGHGHSSKCFVLNLTSET